MVPRMKELYLTTAPGSLPTPQQCEDGPPNLRLLAKVPNLPLPRVDAVMYHFFTSTSPTDFECRVMLDTGEICEKIYKEAGVPEHAKGTLSEIRESCMTPLRNSVATRVPPRASTCQNKTESHVSQRSTNPSTR